MVINDSPTFKPLNEVEIKAMEKQNASIGKKIDINDAELEAELDLFNKQEDTLYSPVTGKPMVVVRRLSLDEIDILTGKELRKFKQEIPEDIAEMYDEKVYKVLSDVIVKPKHDVAWWKQGHMTPDLVKAIISHVERTLKSLGTDAERFR